jgi:chitin disaccharide deacetylase
LFISWILPGLARTSRGKNADGARSLAERMGYSAGDRLLILNCDDFGCSHSANRAIERALREGAATSASLMPPCPWARSAAKASRDLDIGIHLTLTSEYPAYRWASISGAPSLHDRDGYLPKTVREVWSRAEPDDIERECRAQIDLALEWGVDVTHLNSHMDILELDRIYFDISLKLAKHYELPLRLSRPSPFPFSYISRSKVRQAGVSIADDFFAPPWGEPVRKGLFSQLKKLAPGITEVGLHPVEDSEELRAYDTENAEIRINDAECVMSDDLKDLISSSRINPIGFRPLRDAMRAEATIMRNTGAPKMPELLAG